MTQPTVAVLPAAETRYLTAVALGGGVVADLGPSTTGLVWTDSQTPDQLLEVLRKNLQISWVQLPFAGVDNFRAVFDYVNEAGLAVTFTSAKGAYREPVAEHALMLALALARAIPERVRTKTWGRKFAATLFDSKVLIVGGGGIAEEILRLLEPFRVNATVLRRHPNSMNGVDRVLTLSELDAELPNADFVFLAAALTDETRGLFNANRFAAMKKSAYLINIARGPIVVSRDLEIALANGQIAGAGIDVTDPEPLPDGHPLWSTPNLIITPHTADTPEMCLELLGARIERNVSNLIASRELEGLVNLDLGY